MIPDWLHDLSVIFVILGFLCALIIAWHVTRNPQHMWIMNIVWLYFRYGRLASKQQTEAAQRHGDVAAIFDAENCTVMLH